MTTFHGFDCEIAIEATLEARLLECHLFNNQPIE